MLFDVRCPGCGLRGWSPCAGCIGGLGPAGPASIGGAASVVALFDHEGVGRRLIHALKYEGDRAIARWLGASIAANADPQSIDVVTWAPTAAARRRQRGFDQGRLLASRAAKSMHRPLRGLLRRLDQASQTGAPRRQRLRGPQFEPRRSCAGVRVLLIDDVLTTGSTARVATTALLRAGAAAVHVIVCSRTGAPGSDEMVEAGDLAA